MAIDFRHSEPSEQIRGNARLAAEHMFRPYSRKYDRAEHSVPVELEKFESLSRRGSARGGASDSVPATGKGERQLRAVIATEQLCWGDVGLTLARPGSGLGNAAIHAAGTPEQRATFGNCYASMAITEPHCGSDSKQVRTSARLEGDQWVLNGEKIFVTDGDRSDTVVVWATLNPDVGKAAIRSFVVPKTTPGLKVVRLERKLGIRASDTATIHLDDCRIPRGNLLGGKEEVKVGASKAAFGAAMQTFDNTRPLVAAMAVGCAQASLDMTRDILSQAGVQVADESSFGACDRKSYALMEMQAEIDAARYLTWKAAWMADAKQPNSAIASMSKAKAGRLGNLITMQCVELCGPIGYSEDVLLEKFARDSKILDIFEGTQQIQQLIVARHLLGLTSAQLR